MAPLPTDLRRLLERKVVEARDAAEDAARGALKCLAVDRAEPFPSMSEAERQLRRVLRARARQLGSFHEPLADSPGFALLVAEVAYEQWHRMLFARFLAENGLLIHPEHGVAVTLAECAELAPEEGETDEWMLAARYASAMLPGIFRTGDPALQVRFAPEGRQALERILSDLPADVFAADDSLGWVYQFWQSKRKKEVNASERKIGGADLPPVTQLFTEHYMVAFLLENSLGAWWAGKYPDSALLKECAYLRFADDGTPAAGTFEGWPERVADITMMDPCCGSGHFLVAAFEMLRRMREEEEGLAPTEAADAVLADNLFGLELDGRCVQIAVFALALAAWKVGGYRKLPSMNIACSGVPARGKVEEWRKLAGGDTRLADVLERLCHLFKDADTLGSLIDPRRAAETDRLTGVAYEEVEELLHRALTRFGGDDPAQQVFARAAEDVATAAALLAGRYTLVATNPPYLSRQKHGEALQSHLVSAFPTAKADLATAFLLRLAAMSSAGGSYAVVSPLAWLTLGSYRRMREQLLREARWNLVVWLGTGAFDAITGAVVNVGIYLLTNTAPSHRFAAVDVSAMEGAAAKSHGLSVSHLVETSQQEQLSNPDSRVVLGFDSSLPALSNVASSLWGLRTADNSRFVRQFWEIGRLTDDWERLQGSVTTSKLYGGRECLLHWQAGRGELAEYARLGLASLQGRDAWGHRGVAVALSGDLACTLYTGEIFANSVSAVWPADDEGLPAIWAYVSSPEYAKQVRVLDHNYFLGANQTLLKVPFDLEHWTKVAAEKYPNGLPEPHSDDPTQWLFQGNVVGSEYPLHVAVARLLGYAWPDQKPDELDRFSDTDGIVCLPPVSAERPAADRLLELLSAAYGGGWSHSVLEGLLKPEGAPDLETWLRDRFFASHCKLFANRPFIWHIWDGRKDGFAALVSYHKLDRRLLERLTYTTLQAWIDRQKAEADAGKGGAEARLAAASELKGKLELILEGEPPYDIYVRWKLLAKQPIGWEPDINDGVRLNVRPFVEAGVLRSKFNVHWKKDRGKNPDGSERLNDLHYTVAQKRAAREGAATG